MFTMSLRFNARKVAIGLVVIVSVISAAFIFANRNSGQLKETDLSGAKKKSDSISKEAASNEERLKFLESFGWKISEEALEIAEVIIPEEFDDVYLNYNEIQKEQGMDLAKLRGKRVKRYTYAVKNYPGTTSEVRANLLVYNGKIVGGDISSTSLDGFMHGFAMRETHASTRTYVSGLY
ncbi:MAG: DUF4830 domain-containing protein [Oscillospiraceae bacterium]|nr:DUF4830 domain-containing protein [Oscillospiraceae bacterium]